MVCSGGEGARQNVCVRAVCHRIVNLVGGKTVTFRNVKTLQSVHVMTTPSGQVITYGYTNGKITGISVT
jgi:hypothetical protein